VFASDADLMAWKSLREVPDSDVFAKQHTKKARFLVDESLGIHTTEFLRSLGWNVKDAAEVGLRGHSDEDVFAFGHKDDRILLTHDEDFLDDRKFPPHRNPGLIILLGASGGDFVLIEALLHALNVIGYFREIYRGSKTVVSSDGVLSITMRNATTGAMERTKYRLTGKRMPEE
jgi:predicted nuclease of predicted toxin-antitoxin system